MHIDIDILVYALIAAVLLGRLWAVLGSRQDSDTQRPNPFVAPPPKPQEVEAAYSGAQAPPSRMLPFSLPPASLAGGLAQVEAADKSFNEKQFLLDARATFTHVVETYATGDLTSLSTALSPDLLAHFQRAADARKTAGQIAQSRVLRIKDAEVIAARAEGTQCSLTVKFTSDQENIVRDSHGAIVGGIEGKGEEVADIWVFTRDSVKTDAKWVVSETRG